MTSRSLSRPYGLSWRVLDLLDGIAAAFPSAPGKVLAPVLLLLPAVLLIGLSVIGLTFVFEESLHRVDHATMMASEARGIDNYLTIYRRAHYTDLATRSIVAALLVALVNLILGFPYAYVMVRAQSAFVRKLLLACVFFPFLLGTVVRAYAWLVVLGREGLVNDLLGLFGFAPISIVYTINAVIVGLVQFYLPLTILTIVPAVTAIDEAIDEAATSLGAPLLRSLRTVILPMAAPGLAGAFVLVLALVFSDMAVPALLGGGRADFLTNAIYSDYAESGDRGVGAALCIVTTVICTGLVIGFAALRSLAARLGNPAHE